MNRARSAKPPQGRIGCTKGASSAGLWIVCLALALGLAWSGGVAHAQCPVPAPAPPVLDGALDPIYAQRGFTTDYTANDGSTARLHQLDDKCIDDQFIWLVWEISLGFVDNSYGDNRNQGAIFPWPKGHSFGDLAESDGQRLQILNVCGEDVVDLFMDYLDQGNAYGTPSGYGADPFASESVRFLINGGDWNDFRYQTSQLFNLNSLGFCANGNCTVNGVDLLADSPPWVDEDAFVPQAPFGGWIYPHYYEMRIDRSVFSTPACAQGTPALIRTDPVELHASPSKTGLSPVDLFREPAALGDFVWLDADRDGVQDAGERGLANVTIDLYKDDGDGVFEPDVGTTANDDGSAALTTVTDADGRYLFDRIGEGRYFVVVTDTNGVLAGLSLTVGPQSETNPTGVIDLPIGSEYLLADFGYAPADLATGVVGDYVWSDADADGIQDAGEPGLGGVTVDLVDFDTGTVVATTTTTADGRYLFTGVAPGNYTVDVTDTAGVLAGYTLTVGPQAETDPATPFSLVLGAVYLNADFGYDNDALGTIGDTVWFDVDEDAVKDGFEPGFGNVTLALVDDADGDGIWDAGELIVASTVTALDGSYQFVGLPLDDGGGDGDADYLVHVTDTGNVLGPLLPSIFLPLGNTANGISKIAPYGLAVAGGTPANPTADFGYLIDNPEALVGDRVWYDVDGDGVQDPTEPGIEGVRIVLHNDKNQNGLINDPDRSDPELAHRTTDVNGNYFFQRLDFDNNGEGYIVFVSEFNSFHVFDGLLDLDGDGISGEVNGDDDGTVEDVLGLTGYPVIDGRIDVDRDGVIETNGEDSGFVSGFKILSGRIDLNRDGLINAADSRFAPLGTYTQTGDPDQPGVTCTTCDGKGAVVASTGNTIILTVDFGYDSIGTFEVGDTVYHDLDADGTQDFGEPGLAFVSLALFRDLDGDGAVDFGEPLVAQAVTDANGSYLFDDLVVDDYVVAVTDANGILTGYTQTQGQPFEPVASAELSTLTKDFGFVRNLPASISNFVWEDLDGDGVQDPGEPGLRNVVVRLLDPGPDGQPGGGDDVVVATMATDASGFYDFAVQSGDYFVEVVPPALYQLTLANQGSELSDSDPSQATGQAAVTFLIIGENDPTWDAGLFRPVAIGDRVWLDVDGDGVQDVGEPGLSNVSLRLLDAGGTPIGTLVTDLAGDYVFGQRPPATYRVDLDETTLPAGLTLSGGTDPSSSSALLSGQAVFDKDFGYTAQAGAVVGDFVWSDADADGVQDPGEPGIGGVTLDLVAAGPDGVFGTADDVVAATTTTAADGSYLFTGVVAGDYRVDVTDTGGVLAGYTPTTGPHSTGDPSVPLSVAAGTAYLQADFGYFAAGLGTIGDRVWLDGDGDGVRDAGELGIGGVTLALVRDLDADGVWDAGEPIVAGTITAADGTYAFTGLSLDDGDGDADYLVVVTDTAGALLGLEPTSGAAGVDDNAQTSPYAVALSAGSPSNTTADFGYNRAGSIGDRLWSDADGDGVQDPGEPGIGGVTLDLLGAGADGLLGTADDVVVDTVTTAADGSYLFPLLLPGSYRVSVTDTGGALAGYVQTGDPDEAGACATCDGASSLVLASGASDLTRDFGYRNAALHAISGTVFHDLDADGVHDDPPEGGFPGVTVDLWLDVNGNGAIEPAVDQKIAVTTTDGVGDYAFPGLPDDDYVVAVGDQAGVLVDYTLTSGLDQIPVTLAGADVTDVDFGYVRDPQTGAIGDTVWLDRNPDGVRGPTEPGLSGVVLRLYADLDGDGVAEPGGDDGAALATTTTDADGNYLFSGLPAGSYFVDLDETTLPTGLTPTIGTSDPSTVVGLPEGRRYLDADFGYVPASGTAALGDRVWHDVDGDGQQDAGEIGIPGITITVQGPSCAPCTFVTNERGVWLATGLAPGHYTVDYDGADVVAAGFDPVPTNTGGEPTYEIDVVGGDVFLHLDYGFAQPGTLGSIGDRVWLDADGDGVQDAGESGISGVTLDLLGPGGNGVFGDADDQVLATTTTDGQGLYDFVGLPAGSYRVRVTDGQGVLGGLTLTGGSSPTATIVLAAGQDFHDADFGYAPGSGTGSIGNLVWHDADGDGVRDAGEDGIEGVTVALWRDVDGDGVITPGIDNRIRTAVTDVNGEYELLGLPAGAYLVDVTDANGVLAGFTRTTGTPGADDNSQADPYPVVLAAGQANRTADFGYFDADAPFSISGTVFEDDDQDGLFDEGIEFEVGGIVVRLDRVVDGQRYRLGETTTDAFGAYDFGNLPAGDYRVSVVTDGSTIDGYLQTTQVSTGGSEPVTLPDDGSDPPNPPPATDDPPNSTNNDFGFWNGGATSTPITLASFASEATGGGVRFTWTTATELGNVGFHLWAVGQGGFTRLTAGPIPTKVVDSTEPQRYEVELLGVTARRFVLEDVDVLGTSRYHGPFELGRSHGNPDLQAEPIDWSAIRAEQALSLDGAGNLLSFARGSNGGQPAPAVAHLAIAADGVYRVTYEELTAAGADFSRVPVAHLALTLNGEPVPIRISGTGLFGPGDAVELVGEARDSIYGSTHVYVLTADPQLARRMRPDPRPVRPGDRVAPFYVEERRTEVDRTYSPLAPNGDPWFDAWLFTFGSPASADLPLGLDGWEPGAAPVEVTVELWGATAADATPDHHVTVEVGGQPVADERFDGQVAREIGGEVPDWALETTGNELTVGLPGDTGSGLEMVMVDAYRVRYPRRFEARDGALRFTAAGEAFRVSGLPSADVRVFRRTGDQWFQVDNVRTTGAPGDYAATFTGHSQESTYWVASGGAIATPPVSRPSSSALPDEEAELLVITHPTFVAGIEPLVERRRAEGWSVGVADVEAVLAEHGHGQWGPEGIGRYVRWAAEHLGTTHVLLVGGDTYDYMDVLGIGSISFIPSPYAATGDLVRFAPADSLYGDLDGDGLPELPVGRFPVRTAAELEAIVAKTLDYGAGATAPRAVVAADGFDRAAGFSFTGSSEQIAALVPDAWDVERIYLDELPLSQARQSLLGELDAGPRLVSYMGHSGPTAWSFSGLFTTGDAERLANHGRPSLVTQWGCWTTYYVSPSSNTLGHRLLLSGDRGAAAVLGAATLTEARSERALARQIYLRLFEPGRTVGRVLVDGKRALVEAGSSAVDDVILGWTLLGDPTLVVVP